MPGPKNGNDDNGTQAIQRQQEEYEINTNAQQGEMSEENASFAGPVQQNMNQVNQVDPVDNAMPEEMDSIEGIKIKTAHFIGTGFDQEEKTERDLKVESEARQLEEKGTEYKTRHSEMLRRYNEMKDDRWGRGHKGSGNSEEMEAVKSALAALMTMFDQQVSKKESEAIRQAEELKNAYDTVIEKCQYYIDHRKARFAHGKRRKNWVIDLKNFCTQEKEQIKECSGVVRLLRASDKKADIRISEFVYYSHAIEADYKKMGTGNTTVVHQAENIQIKIEREQTEENAQESQQQEGQQQQQKEVTGLYFKEDRPTILDDMPGYIEQQYKKMKGLIEEVDALEKVVDFRKRQQELYEVADKEGKSIIESPLQDILQGTGAHLSDQRFERLTAREIGSAYRFFRDVKETLDKTLEDGKPEEHKKLVDALTNFMAQDWNSAYAAVDVADKWRIEMNKQYGGKYSQLDKTWLILQKMNFKDEDGKWINGFDMNNEYQRDVAINIIDDLEHSIRAIMLTATGKEMELASQVRGRAHFVKGQGYVENPITSSLVAEKLGQGNLVVRAYRGYAKDSETQSVKKGVFQEIAQGKELQFVIDAAEDYQKQHNLPEPVLHYSPEAARQMMNLWILDLICGQTDRHFQNLKVQVDTKSHPGKWIVTEIKGYDNDMSFGTLDLEKNYEQYDFQTETDVKIDKVGHLYSLQQKPIRNAIIRRFMEKRIHIPKESMKDQFQKKGKAPVATKKVTTYEDRVQIYARRLKSLEAGLEKLEAAKKEAERRATRDMFALREVGELESKIKHQKEEIESTKRDIEHYSKPYISVEESVKDVDQLENLPNLRHIDAELYEQIRSYAENGAGPLLLTIKDMNLPQESLDALEKRIRQVWQMIQKAENLAKEEGRDDFKLQPEQWKNVKNLTDLVFNPGKSYLSAQDGDFFLLKDKEFQEFKETIPGELEELKKQKAEAESAGNKKLEKELEEQYSQLEAAYKELSVMEEMAATEYNKQRQEVNLEQRQRKFANFNNAIIA